jgi:small subunit ribosomal protein S17
MSKKKLQGTVVSNKMAKTVVVLVGSIVESSKYKRRFEVQKKYKADTQEQYNVGDTVLIEECRPVSKEKSWKVIKKIAESKTAEAQEPQDEAAELLGEKQEKKEEVK